MKITADDARQHEADMISEAIGCELEVNEEFVERYCSPDVAEILATVPERDLADVLTPALGDAREWGDRVADASIILPVGKIEEQRPGDMDWAEYLDDPSDWTINGDFAYTTMDSVRVDVDLDKLREAIADLAE